MTATDAQPTSTPPVTPERRPGELGVRELLRWSWRQLTSMRTALVLLLLLALGAVPGSVVPQEDVDSLAVSRWQEAHPDLTPVYERLGLFSVFDSVWFSAIYLLLAVSLVGCIVPRSAVYWRALRAAPPPAPRHLTRLPDAAAYSDDRSPDAVLEQATRVLGARRYRVVVDGDAVRAERGHLREAGNLLFHLSVLVVLAGFAVGGLFGYQGGVIVVEGSSFTNRLTQYDDFAPGRLFGADDLDPFGFTVEDFSAEWVREGPARGTARGFSADLAYREGVSGPERSYDLRVNHPLRIADTEVFLIGHGYAPVVTVRDGTGEVAYQGPTVFLPEDQGFLSFGVIKAPDARPRQLGLEGLFYPTFLNVAGEPVNVTGEARNPLLSMLVYSGDLGLDSGAPQSVYVLDKSDAEQVRRADGKPLRLDLSAGETARLPGGLGSVTFEGVRPWVRVQISQSPGKEVALLGVVLALLGLLGSLYVRPRRVWVRARPAPGGGGSAVEVGVLERSSGGEPGPELESLVADLRGAEEAR